MLILMIIVLDSRFDDGFEDEEWKYSASVTRILDRVRWTTIQAYSLLLITGTVIALIWANSPWAHGYHALWETSVGIDVGGRALRRLPRCGSIVTRGWVQKR